MKRESRNSEEVKCFGCGKALNDAEQEEGLCSSCSERSVEEGFELFEWEERDKVRADGMMYV